MFEQLRAYTASLVKYKLLSIFGCNVQVYEVCISILHCRLATGSNYQGMYLYWNKAFHVERFRSRSSIMLNGKTIYMVFYLIRTIASYNRQY